jgi:RNA polymerase sigma factor (sigma-70 family)
VRPRSREAAVEVLHEHGPVLLAAARVITLDDDEAKDLVQTTFEIALRRIDSLREPTALRAWLLRIETREAFRAVRRLRRVVRLDGHVRELASPGGPVGERAEIREALLTLPGRTRVAVALHYLAGLRVTAPGSREVGSFSPSAPRSQPRRPVPEGEPPKTVRFVLRSAAARADSKGGAGRLQTGGGPATTAALNSRWLGPYPALR